MSLVLALEHIIFNAEVLDFKSQQALSRDREYTLIYCIYVYSYMMGENTT